MNPFVILWRLLWCIPGLVFAVLFAACAFAALGPKGWREAMDLFF